MRVVHDRRQDLSAGVQTGYIEHRRSRIPVWRPCNPNALGLGRGWSNGQWRNVYDIELVPAPVESEHILDTAEVSLANVTARLPAAHLVVAADLARFLRQQLR
jgi:hypothetical protein